MRFHCVFVCIILYYNTVVGCAWQINRLKIKIKILGCNKRPFETNYNSKIEYTRVYEIYYKKPSDN